MSRHFCAKSVFTDAPNDLTGNDIHVYTYLVACSNAKDGMAWPSLESIITDTRLSRATVSRAITNLTGSGLVVIKKRTTRKTKRGRGVNMYFLPKVLADQVGPEPQTPTMSRQERAKIMAAQMAAISDEEFDAQIDHEFLNANLGVFDENGYTDDMMAGYTDAADEAYCMAELDDTDVVELPKPKTKPKTKPKPELPPMPAELVAVSGFASAWANWLEYRGQAKLKTLTPIGLTRQWSALITAHDRGCDIVAAIDTAITSHWQGIHPKSATNGGVAVAPKAELSVLDKIRLAQNAAFEAILNDETTPKAAKTVDTEALPF